MVDVYSALRQLLLGEPTIADLVEGIYVGEIPAAKVGEIPLKCVLIAPSGGLETRGFRPTVQTRADVWCFAESYGEASPLDRAVFECVRHLDRKTKEDVLIHSIDWSGGPYMVRDGQTGWPALWRSVAISSDVRAVIGG